MTELYDGHCDIVIAPGEQNCGALFHAGSEVDLCRNRVSWTRMAQHRFGSPPFIPRWTGVMADWYIEQSLTCHSRWNWDLLSMWGAQGRSNCETERSSDVPMFLRSSELGTQDPAACHDGASRLASWATRAFADQELSRARIPWRIKKSNCFTADYCYTIIWYIYIYIIYIYILYIYIYTTYIHICIGTIDIKETSVLKQDLEELGGTRVEWEGRQAEGMISLHRLKWVWQEGRPALCRKTWTWLALWICVSRHANRKQRFTGRAKFHCKSIGP